MAIMKRTTKKKGTTYTPRVKDPNGKWYPTETFSRKTDAERFERKLLEKKDVGQLAQSSFLKNLTLSNYWKEWASECRSEVSEGWQYSQDQMFRSYLDPVLGSKKILDIKTRDISNVLLKMRELHRADQTCLHVYNLLHRLFENAVHHFEYIESNPVKKKLRPKVKKTQRNFLMPDEARRLLFGVTDHWLGPPVWIGLLAGLRPGEIQALLWNSIDFECMQIIVNSSYQRKIKKIQPFTKQGDWARVPLNEALASYLREVSPHRMPSTFVAPNSKGGMLNYNSFNRALKLVCRSLGLTEITPHELRHSATELIIEAGGSGEDVRRFLNHSSMTVTQNYIHRSDERLTGVVGDVGKRLELVKPTASRVSQKFHTN